MLFRSSDEKRIVPLFEHIGQMKRRRLCLFKESAPFVLQGHAVRVINDNDDRCPRMGADAAKSSFQCRARESKNDENDNQRSQNKEEQLPYPDPSHFALLQFLQKREGTEFDRAKLSDIEQVENDGDRRCCKPEEDKGVKEGHRVRCS